MRSWKGQEAGHSRGWHFQAASVGSTLCQMFPAPCVSLISMPILRTEALFGLARLMLGPWRRKGKASWCQDSSKQYLRSVSGFSRCHGQHPFWLCGRGEHPCHATCCTLWLSAPERGGCPKENWSVLAEKEGMDKGQAHPTAVPYMHLYRETDGHRGPDWRGDRERIYSKTHGLIIPGCICLEPLTHTIGVFSKIRTICASSRQTYFLAHR